MAFAVVYDANVLYGNEVRDLLAVHRIAAESPGDFVLVYRLGKPESRVEMTLDPAFIESCSTDRWSVVRVRGGT